MVAVLHVAQPTDAGVARCVAALVADQRAAGWRVAVACPASGPLSGWVAGADVRVWPARRAPGPTVPAETLRLARLVRAVRPDLVHLHSSKAGLAGRLALRGRRPTVFQPHAWSFDAVGGPTRTATLAWERRAARWADVVVCVSEGERRHGEAAGVRARWAVVPNGVDLAAYPPATDADRAEARARLELPPAAPLAVCVGRLSRQKGQDLLLDAWPAVRAAVPDAQLVLVGDGPDAATLRARRPSGVVLAGARDDVADWLAAADVAVLPSRWEGMSLAAIEALARGRPVVASDVTGMREVVAPGTGALVPPGDVRALATAVADRLADRDRAAAEGRAAATAAQAHDVRRTAAAMRDVYADVLARRSR